MDFYCVWVLAGMAAAAVDETTHWAIWISARLVPVRPGTQVGRGRATNAAASGKCSAFLLFDWPQLRRPRRDPPVASFHKKRLLERRPSERE